MQADVEGIADVDDDDDVDDDVEDYYDKRC